MTALAGQGVRVFIEIGPDGTLSALGSAAVEAASDGERPAAVFIPVQRPAVAAADALTGRPGSRPRSRASGLTGPR